MDRLAGTISTAGDPEEGLTVNIGDEEPQQEEAPEAIPTANILGAFNPTERGRITKMCLEDYDEDVKSREGHMRQLKRWYELYAGATKLKNWPFQNAANVSVPLETYAILQVHGRLFDMIIPSKGDIFHAIATRATDPQSVDIAERTELFANWYVRENIPGFRESYDATIWQVVAFGDCFRYSYWDYTENRLCCEWISVDDMVVPYSCKVTDPTMRGVPRYTLVKHLSLFEIQDRAESGEYDAETVKALKPGDISSRSATSEFKEAVKDVDGTTESTARAYLDDEPRDVYEQHRWLRLPNDPTRNPAFDGKPHPVKICIEKGSEKLLSVVLREEDDPRDARRFAKEKAQYDQALQANQAHQASGGMTQDPQTGAPMPMPPPPPLPQNEPRPVRQREVFFFTHWMGFQSEGFYGLGLGHFVGPLNEAINTMFNQSIDRATVNNAGGGIVSRQVRFQRGPITRQPGQYTEVDAPPSAIKDGLQNWPMVPPDPEGRWFIQYIEQMANRVSGAGDTLSGEPVGTNETARAALARTEQAQKQISVLASRLIGYLTYDAKIMWRLFSVYLDEQEYHDVVDGAGKPRQVQIGRDDFKADAKVVPTADSRMTSHAQRVSDAMDYYQFVTNPQGAPEVAQNPALRRAAIEAVLYSMDRHEAIELLGPPPGPPQPPPPKPQWEENAGFLRDQDQPVNKQDDDDAHLIEIQAFKQDPIGYAKLSPTARKMMDNHERGHYAAKIEKERAAHEQQQTALQRPPGGPGIPMAGPPGNPAPPGIPPS